jgi:hypothetical protein
MEFIARYGGAGLEEKSWAKTIRKISYHKPGASIPYITSLGNEIAHHSAAFLLGILLSYCRYSVSLGELGMAAFYFHFVLRCRGGEISLQPR